MVQDAILASCTKSPMEATCPHSTSSSFGRRGNDETNEDCWFCWDMSLEGKNTITSSSLHNMNYINYIYIIIILCIITETSTSNTSANHSKSNCIPTSRLIIMGSKRQLLYRRNGADLYRFSTCSCTRTNTIIYVHWHIQNVTLTIIKMASIKWDNTILINPFQISKSDT